MAGAKNARKKQARNNIKKAMKSFEKCPYCKKACSDLDEHLRRDHPFRCGRCGQRFSHEGQWKHHMRDAHGLKGEDATKDDCKSKVERWLQNSKAVVSPSMAVEEGNEEEVPMQHRHECEICGAVVLLPVDLSMQGLSFNCSLAGHQCASAAITRLAVPADARLGMVDRPAFAPATADPSRPMSDLFLQSASPGLFQSAFGSASFAAVPGAAQVGSAQPVSWFQPAGRDLSNLALGIAVPDDDDDL